MDTNPEREIRWEKLDEVLGQPGQSPGSEDDLSLEEKEALLFMRRVRATIRPEEAAERSFPMENDWQSVRHRIESEKERGSRIGALVFMRRYRYAAAILVAAVLGGGYWWQRSTTYDKPAVANIPVKSAVLPPAKGVQLILAGGQHVNVKDSQEVKDADGVNISTTGGGSVVYQPEGKRIDALLYDTLVVPRGNKTRITLTDGTKVWVNADSRLIYPRIFVGGVRKVSVEGEAYFEVSSDPVHPFVVHANDMDVKVLGTSFNVNTYDRDLYTTLERGRVAVEGGQSELVLTPGEQSVFSGAQRTVRKLEVDTRLYTAWKDDQLYMENASFEKIARTLGREYDYELRFTDTALANLHFTVDMQAPAKLQEVLDHITSTTEGIRFETEGREVRIFRKTY